MKQNYLKPTMNVYKITSDDLMQIIVASVGGDEWDDADARKNDFWDKTENDDTNLWGSVWDD